MNTQLIKSVLMQVLGSRSTAYVHALRFVYLLKQRRKDDPEMALLDRFLGEGDVAIDVGANGADWTYWLHEAVGSAGHVLAFEADPYYAQTTGIAIRMMKMKGVTLFPHGLSDREETVMLRVTDANGRRTAGLGSVDKNADKAGDRFEPVSLKRLDSLLDEFPELKKARLIKCDVEGYELPVFRGSAELLRESRPVVILEVGRFEEQGYTARDLHDFFAGFDYSAFAMVGGEKLAPTDKMLDHPDALSVNRILLPAELAGTIDDLLLARV
jgi:FkbM family methyltransferase